MPRGLDHIVHAVGDLDAAAKFYRRCGFQVGARNRHPWGTHNHVVQLDEFYIEILAVAEPEKIVPQASGAFSFGAFHQHHLAYAEGFDMMLLSSDDAIEDAQSFKSSGIGDFDVFDFARDGLRPDGSSAKLAFSLTFACDPRSPEIGYASCQHHFPENFWNSAFRNHPNGAKSVAGVVIVAKRPQDHADFLKAWTGVEQVEERVSGIFLRTPRGEIEVLEAKAFEDRFGVVATPAERALIVGLRLAVDNLDVVESVLRDGDVPLHRHGATLCVRSQAAFGAVLIFEQTQIA